MADSSGSLLSTRVSSRIKAVKIFLHPLVLLTISDYITRHTVRKQDGPIVGALMGEHTGRQITLEHVFELVLKRNQKTGDVELDCDWFEARLQQLRDVFTNPPLDIVGWYTLMPRSGPQVGHLPIHRTLLERYPDSTILLGIHPAEIGEGSTDCAQFPLTIYDGIYESEESPNDNGDDTVMQDGRQIMQLRYKEMSYSVVVDDAERISLDFVARGGGNATALDAFAKGAAKDKGKGPAIKKEDVVEDEGKGPAIKKEDVVEDKGKGNVPTTEKDDAKGKGKEYIEEDDESVSQIVLSRRQEESVAGIITTINAIKMLQARINLLSTYLQALPPSYNVSSERDFSMDEDKTYEPVNESIVRSIDALLERFKFLIPTNEDDFARALTKQHNDVHAVSLLKNMTDFTCGSVGAMVRYKIINQAKHGKSKVSKHDVRTWEMPAVIRARGFVG